MNDNYIKLYEENEMLKKKLINVIEEKNIIYNKLNSMIKDESEYDLPRYLFISIIIFILLNFIFSYF